MSSSFRFAGDDSGEPLYLQLKRAIAVFLKDGGFSAGEKIPSENDFCAHSAVSIRTVRRALAELERDGVLKRRRGRGSFLAAPPQAPAAMRGTIGILFSDIAHVTNPVFLTLLHAMESEIGSRGMNFHLYATGPRGVEGVPLGSLLPQELPDALIATSALDAGDLKWLKEQKIPFCAFNRYRNTKVNCVRFDYAKAAELGLEHLARLGAKNVLCLCGQVGEESDEVVYGNDLFRAAAGECAVRLRLKVDFLSIPQDRASGVRAAAACAASGTFPDAFFTLNPLPAEGVLAARKELNLPAFRLVCCHAAPEGADATVIGTGMDELGRSAVDILFQRLTGDPAAVSEKIFSPVIDS